MASAKDPDFRSADKRTILIFSDMLQRTGNMNFYKKIPSGATVQGYGIPFDAVLFERTFLHIHQVTRQQPDGRPQPRRVSEFQVRGFWNEWFEKHGARVSWSSDVREERL